MKALLTLETWKAWAFHFYRGTDTLINKQILSLIFIELGEGKDHLKQYY